MKRKKKKIFIIVGILLAIACACVLIFAHPKSNDDDMEEETETTAFAETMDIVKTITANGEIGSSIVEKKTPHASYKLEKICVNAGQAIHQGDPIIVYTNGQTMDAPYDCVVESWDLPDPKKTITNDHYVKLAGTKILKIELNVDEGDVLTIKEGCRATVTVKATDKTYQGEVSFVSDIGQYEGGTSTFIARVIFNNDGNVRLGMNGKARVVLGSVKNVLGVPVGAVYSDGEKTYVSVKKGDDSTEVEVTTGFENDEYIEIKSGLEEGQEVIVNDTSSDEDDYGDYEDVDILY